LNGSIIVSQPVEPEVVAEEIIVDGGTSESDGGILCGYLYSASSGDSKASGDEFGDK